MHALPSPCLVVLVGPVASGKTTWARAWFDPAQVVSSDALRALVGEAEHDITASDDAFTLLEDVIERRLRRRLTTVVDSLGLDGAMRSRWREQADRHGVATAAVLFDTSGADCRRRNAAREVPVRADVVRRQLARWPDVATVVRSEPWHHVLDAEPVAVVAPALATPARRPSRSAPSTTPPRTAAGQATDRRTEPTPRDVPHAPVRFGLHLSSVEWPGGAPRFAEVLGRIAGAAERVGVEHLWLMDHLRQIPQVGAPWHDLPEPYSTLAWLAAVTERVRLGVLVSPAFLRPPMVLAKSIASLDVLSGGRAICGLGVGWFSGEYEAAGIRFPGVAERYDHLEDALRALPLIWGKGAPSYEGHRTTITEALCYPRPLQERVPIWIGGSGRRRTLRLVAEHADACNLFGEPDAVAQGVAALRAHCAAVGRDPAEIEVSHLSTVLVGRDGAEVDALVDRLRPRRVSRERFARQAHAGTVEQHALRVRRYADAGVDTMIVRLVDVAEPGALDRLGALIRTVRTQPGRMGSDGSDSVDTADGRARTGEFGRV